MKKSSIEDLIALARGSLTEEVNEMSFKEFDTAITDQYKERAKAAWGDTSAYKEYEKKTSRRSAEEEVCLGNRLMEIFKEFGGIREKDASSAEAQALVKKLQDFISGNYYTCTKEILAGLGKMYAAGGEFTENIDHAGGGGTAGFAAAAIDIYCRA